MAVVNRWKQYEGFLHQTYKNPLRILLHFNHFNFNHRHRLALQSFPPDLSPGVSTHLLMSGGADRDRRNANQSCLERKKWPLPICPFLYYKVVDKEYQRTSRNIEYVQTQMFDPVFIFHLFWMLEGNTNNKINAIVPPPSSHQEKE